MRTVEASEAGVRVLTSLNTTEQTPQRNPIAECASTGERAVLGQKAFRSAIALERKRTERSREPFLLMLVDAGWDNPQDGDGVLEKIGTILIHSSRETDVVGWYSSGTSLGALFTSLVVNDRELIRSTILSRLFSLLDGEIRASQIDGLNISFHFYPDEWGGDQSGEPSDRALYPDLTDPGRRRQSRLVVKRMIDVAGSALIMAALFPLFVAVALAVKLTSKGPVLFRQTRVGQYGRQFVLYKFRTMYAGSDPSLHREYIRQLIANQAERNPVGANGAGVYKLTNDPRITRVGKILRRLSLDELPQILNVLKGDMSLVGPRPPIPYELAAYQTWHRRRLLEAKPGVTGLWQVTGRSLVRFDEMVRLDLRYATSWSLWLDVKILLRTPLAVFRGAGAF